MKQTDKLIQSKLKDFEANVPEDLWKKIECRLPSKRRIPVWNRYVRYAAAATLLFACCISGYLLLKPHTPEAALVQQTEEKVKHTDVHSPRIFTPDRKDDRIATIGKHIEKSDGNTTFYSVNKTGDAYQHIPPKGYSYQATESNTDNGQSGNDSLQNEPTPKKQEEKEKSHSENRPLFCDTPSADRYASTHFSRNVKSGNKNSKYAIGVVSTNAISSTEYAQDTRMTRSSLYYAEEAPILKYQHKVPISIGLTVEKQFGSRWGIESGLVYTLLRSDYKTESLQREGKQELHYLGIPLMGRFRFFNTRLFSFYVSAGPRMDFNIYGRRTDDTQSQQAYSTYTENIRDKRIQWSAHLKIGISYVITKHFDLYAEPAVAYFFDNGNKDIANLWKDKPVNFAFHLGVRTNF